ncbi:DUF3283 family protein [Enterovibrio norvegicus]|uniref:DUF3283 family protein n=2 Tax=Enterovibrio norvegicus TaxID=188144 RepID=A0A2N7LGT5_9GAMM|nr:DUF3283 family protein [Enterovibrio norvegicus]OEE62055.1 pyridoxamine 5-phosphate oxidase [Enterovibrio norvegicus]OEF53632.1 pyridoxamine 5-phosphate oxidase [Enterovibrio norvegicus]OEF56886.1 pyridoxamine 5-phosphate oxidase [Enterovibrio norvegicus]PMH69688.1 pyridoxamine 5-phosphate oxidase [Enterovibrio norvegicus]PMI34671.1 pyridoxamine 5-phosphate oxidase [Enterovibrio norvegicus]
MSQNLALLPPDEKQMIELDKQASYAVWQVKNGVAERGILLQQAQAQTEDSMREHFEHCVEKYSKIMGL